GGGADRVRRATGRGEARTPHRKAVPPAAREPRADRSPPADGARVDLRALGWEPVLPGRSGPFADGRRLGWLPARGGVGGRAACRPGDDPGTHHVSHRAAALERAGPRADSPVIGKSFPYRVIDAVTGREPRQLEWDL